MQEIKAPLSAKELKRLAIEEELGRIIEYDRHRALLENIKNRNYEEFFKGDKVTVLELRYKNASDAHLGDRMYRVRTGVVTQVTKSGYLIEGISLRGKPSRDFVNRAHLINGTVAMHRV